MYVLIIPKDICSWDSDQKVFITKETISKERWIIIHNYLDYNVYYEHEIRDDDCIYPLFLFGIDYVRKFIENLLNIEKPYPKFMIEYFKQNNIIIPDKFSYFEKTLKNVNNVDRGI